VVDLGDGAQAGFAEVTLPTISFDVIEYRSGADRVSNTRKLPGRAHYGNVVLRRGLIGDLALYEWVRQVRDEGLRAARNVTVQLLGEDRSVVLTWRIFSAWPARYTGPTLIGKGNEVAIEALELACDRIELE
jgi:phage tail-like protein